MNGGLGVKTDPRTAQELVDLFLARPEGEQAARRFLGDYRAQLYEQMMLAPDDQLAGYRGMLLCIGNLLAAMDRGALHRTIEKAKKTQQ